VLYVGKPMSAFESATPSEASLEELASPLEREECEMRRLGRI